MNHHSVPIVLGFRPRRRLFARKAHWWTRLWWLLRERV